ncbi:ATP-dependent Clp protease ATP-binding subunit ClpA [Campylobacter sp. MIT 12-5580]|uniref:AAA family ATPase n=1 Tax=Campylobacter sp. MIT 12-5580 TaxID=2040651 RepID=UPI0010F63716|nr:AAA family ATPase [Campylobacter sp. MIT 12-5580]TKX30282.1 ATP-dependent Clp protease ATP-binding subunit ClpA [Campylobacter sp. MIT 12-5580]
MKYQEDLKKYLANAKHLSAINRHEFVTCEHLLFALLKLSPDFKEIFEEFADADFDALENELKNHIAQKNQILNKDIEPINSVVLDDILHKLDTEPKIIDFLEELSKDERTYSKFLLEKHALNLNKIEELKTQSELENLKNFTTDLTELATKGKLDPLIGRSFELERMVQILSRRKKNNPILVGEAGVGKTAIVDGLALAITQKKVPQNLANARIFSLDISSLLSGTKYRGDFEKRLKDIVSELQKIDNAILFIDEIHTMVGAGAANESHTDMSNLLKPALSNGTLKCIGATTFMEYKNSFDKNKALSRRFAKIDVDEPSKEECLQILKGLRSTYEKYHGVKFDDEVLQACVELGKKFFTDKFLPDCAIDLLDELGASFKLEKRKASKASLKDLENTLAKMTHSHKVFELDKAKLLKNLSTNLKKEIFGQDEAISSLCATLKQSYAGLKNAHSPKGVFLFTGSSGVGKTELCKALAKNLGLHLERFDMSEYAEKHAISRLIGAPAGYVGYEDGGLLSNAVRKNPFSVILFDEIEKAHPDLSNTFLQIFDNASLTDSSGLRADFQNTIIVMTSNLGLKESNELGFLSKLEEKSSKAVKDFFAPEFLNRIDKIIHFNDLDDSVLEKIVQKELDEISKNLKNISIKADKKLKIYLAKKAYKKEFGVRLLKRVIAEEIGEKLSDELLFGKLKNGGLVELRLGKNDTIEFVF